LEKYMAVLPSRTWPGSDTQKAEDAVKKKRKDKKPKGNQPHFDLRIRAIITTRLGASLKQ
jgi:hypothetical protein